LPKYLDRNTQILGISADSVKSHAEFCDSRATVSLLADTTGEVSKAYGSWMGVVFLRHTYVIDPEGKLQAIFTGVNPTVHSAEC
jgi:peroxiredoxin Q/BCP